MANPSDLEQYQLELINRARLDPAGEAERLGISLNAGLAAGTITTDAKQPLAFNSELNDAASRHSDWMLSQDVFSHTGAGGSDAGDRMRAAGYDFERNWSWAENIAWQSVTASTTGSGSTGAIHDGWISSPGHRANLLDEDFREIGLGILQGEFTSGSTTYDALMVTQNYAVSGGDKFLTGVAYRDSDGDDFYSPGEGMSGLQLSIHKIGGIKEVVTTTSSGGYQATLDSGSYDITLSGGPVSAPVTVTLDIADQNVKLDMVGSDRVAVSTDAAMGQNLAALTLLGVDNLSARGNALANDIVGNKGANELAGAAGDDTLTGGMGNDTLIGGDGNDTAVYDGKRVEYQLSTAGDLVTVGSAQEGVDQLSGIEFIRFSDETISLNPNAATMTQLPDPESAPVPESASESLPGTTPTIASASVADPASDPVAGDEAGEGSGEGASPGLSDIEEPRISTEPQNQMVEPVSGLSDVMVSESDSISLPDFTDTRDWLDSPGLPLWFGQPGDGGPQDGGPSGAMILSDLLDGLRDDLAELLSNLPRTGQPMETQEASAESGPPSLPYTPCSGGLAGCGDLPEVDTASLESL